ncbi:MAG: TlpA family protein disulfide reductase [Candidatus Eisenbacteria bacterium]|nr:TlpA family protein disulfide reductase [Candidatus Eisenbacteria bacterium]
MTARLASRTAIAAIAAIALAGSLAPGAAAAGGTPAPATTPAATRCDAALRDYVFHTVDGRSVTLAQLSGEVVVINLWASWCLPCRRELPGLDALNRELAAGRAGARGRVLAVSIDDDRENAKRFVAEHRLSLPIYYDGPEGLARRLDLDRVPTTIVVDRDGHVAGIHAGGDGAALAAAAAEARRLVATHTAAASTEGGTP